MAHVIRGTNADDGVVVRQGHANAADVAVAQLKGRAWAQQRLRLLWLLVHKLLGCNDITTHITCTASKQDSAGLRLSLMALLYCM